VTTETTPDPEDREEIERLHSEFCDRHNDAAIALQDKSYALGRKRGATEAAGLLEAARGVAEHIEGRQPTFGYLRDTDQSRAALAALLVAISRATGATHD
jgi:hypothetical protein